MNLFLLQILIKALTDYGIEFPKIPELKPKHYRIHLSKAERKGKSFEEIQMMRKEKLNV